MGLAGPHARYQATFSSTMEFCSRNSAVLRLTGLIGILLFSFWIGMSAHWDDPYPLHVDEWFAIGYAQSTLDAGGLEYPNPYRQGEISFHPEMGFHLLLGFLKTTTGLSWMSLYRVAPGVLLALLGFLTYSFGRRAGFGWAAAMFVSLIPTSVGTLGPAFLVPVSAAMLLIPVTLLVLHAMGEKSDGKSLWILMLILAGTIFVHPTTAVVVTALAGLYLLSFVGEAFARRRYRAGVKLLLAVGVPIMIPVVILGLWIPSLSQKILEQSAPGLSGPASRLGLHTGFTEAFGILGVMLFIMGLFLFIARSDFGVRSYILPGLTGLLIAFLFFVFPTYQIGPGPLYGRGWLYLSLFMVIFAGYGAAVYFRSIPAIARTVAARFGRRLDAWTAVALWAVGTAVVVLAFISGPFNNERRHAYSGYYRVVNERIFADFRWIGRYASPEQTVAMGEPSIAWAYPPVAGPGTTVFQTISSPGTNRRVQKVRQMLSLGEADVSWLRRAGISVFYTCRPLFFTCEELTNDDLFKIRRGVYLVPDSSDKR